MKQRPTKTRAESRGINKCHQLYKPLIELVDALQALEPGGTLVDNVSLTNAPDEHSVRIEYCVRPMFLTIKDDGRMFVLRVVEGTLKDRRLQTSQS
jgi:hypothetical protein